MDKSGKNCTSCHQLLVSPALYNFTFCHHQNLEVKKLDQENNIAKIWAQKKEMGADVPCWIHLVGIYNSAESMRHNHAGSISANLSIAICNDLDGVQISNIYAL